MSQSQARPLEVAQLFERNPGSEQGGELSRAVPKEAADRAEARLRAGDYVRPSGQVPGADIAADSLTHQLVHAGTFEKFNSPETFKPMAQYKAAAGEATKGIDTQEQTIARQQWNSLSQEQRESIRKEMDALDKHTFDIYKKTPKPDTPELDAFMKNLTTSLAPLEQQRDQILHDVWKGLPEDTRRKILQRDEMTPKFHVVQ